MRRQGNYERAEKYLDEIGDEIEFEYGEPYDELSEGDKRQAILDHFFKGLPQYYGSAEDLRDGIQYASDTDQPEISVDRIMMRGTERRVIRDSKTGRFRKWVD